TGEPGNCLGLGRCVPGLRVFSTPTTNGVAASGTFTVPAGCTQVQVFAWGAGGGQAEQLFPIMLTSVGGAGGHVSGLLSTAPGDVFTVWVGGGGHNGTGITGTEGTGSFFGTAANGGLGDSAAGCAGGGGLTSVRQTGSVTRQFTVPAGGGASLQTPGQPA
ncbi:hypothetical protein U0E18_31895, partial [Burkholderia pseudomallei]|nr:hypothetical protein [Burkholderia pseudomallei]